MAARKKTLPPAGLECPGCRALSAELARLQQQQRKQAASARKDARKYESLLYDLRAELAEERELSRKLDDALSYHRFVQPYLLHQFGQHLPEGNMLAAGLSHFN